MKIETSYAKHIILIFYSRESIELKMWERLYPKGNYYLITWEFLLH